MAAEASGGAGFSLDLTAEDMREINDHLRKNPKDLFHIPFVRSHVTGQRVRRLKPSDIRTAGAMDPAVIENTIQHNLMGLHGLAALNRPSFLIKPLVSAISFNIDRAILRVLCVGPRTEAEFFMLLAEGFAPANIHGLDLIGYSPFVKIGDMHDMPYPPNSFHVIFLGWVLGYSNDLDKVAAEVVRVATPGAFVAIGQELDPKSDEELDRTRSFKLKGSRFKDTGEMLKLFKGHVDKVIFRRDVPKSLRHVVDHQMLIFTVKKR